MSKKASEVFKVGENKIGYVSSSFLSEFGNDEIDSGLILRPQTLKKSMSDSDIISELGIKECTLSDIWATLENTGEELKDGNWNIFYVAGHPSLVVRVGWFSGRGRWHVDDWDRGGEWSAGARVFSPATSGAGIVSTSPSASLTLDSAIALLKKEGYKITKEF